MNPATLLLALALSAPNVQTNLVGTWACCFEGAAGISNRYWMVSSFFPDGHIRNHVILKDSSGAMQLVTAPKWRADDGSLMVSCDPIPHMTNAWSLGPEGRSLRIVSHRGHSSRLWRVSDLPITNEVDQIAAVLRSHVSVSTPDALYVYRLGVPDAIPHSAQRLYAAAWIEYFRARDHRRNGERELSIASFDCALAHLKEAGNALSNVMAHMQDERDESP